MNSFWIAVGLSLASALTYLWFSVQQQNVSTVLTKKSPTNSAKILLMFPALILLIAPAGYYYLGNAEKQNDWQMAVENMSQIQAGKSTSIKSGDIQALILALRSSIAQEPQNGQLWFMLAESYFQLRMIDLADAAMQKALRIEARPNWFVANAQILSLRSNASDISKSINLLQNALSIQPEHQSALLTLGFIYLRQEQYEFAIGSWQKLLSLLEKSGNDTARIQKQIDYAKQQLSAKRLPKSD